MDSDALNSLQGDDVKILLEQLTNLKNEIIDLKFEQQKEIQQMKDEIQQMKTQQNMIEMPLPNNQSFGKRRRRSRKRTKRKSRRRPKK